MKGKLYLPKWPLPPQRDACCCKLSYGCERKGGTVGGEDGKEEATFIVDLMWCRRRGTTAGFVKASAIGLRRATCSSIRVEDMRMAGNRGRMMAERGVGWSRQRRGMRSSGWLSLPCLCRRCGFAGSLRSTSCIGFVCQLQPSFVVLHLLVPSQQPLPILY